MEHIESYRDMAAWKDTPIPSAPTDAQMDEYDRQVRDNRRKGLVELTRSHFHSAHWRDGELIYDGPQRPNLTTDSASGFTNRRDWHSVLFGGGVLASAIASYNGTATATGATSLTNSGASFPTAGNALGGYMVVASKNASGTGAVVVGIIQSNTSTVLTVDQWYDPTTWSTTAGSTPNATCLYTIVGQAPAMWLALSTDAGAASASDTTLASEISTNGLARALGTYSHTLAASTYALSKVFNCSGGSTTVNKEAVFGSAVINKGVMPFESAEPSPPTLVSGDQLTQTVTITIN